MNSSLLSSQDIYERKSAKERNLKVERCVISCVYFYLYLSHVRSMKSFQFENLFGYKFEMFWQMLNLFA